MKLTCAREELQLALQRVGRAVTARTTLPVLSNVLLKAGPEGAEAAAYDLSMAIQTAVPAKVSRPGATTVPARLLQEIINLLPEDDISVESTEDTNICTIRAGKATYRIHGQSAQEFPALPEVTGGHSFSLPQSLLRTMIHQTAFASAEEETRPIMTGTLVLVDGGTLTLVATDTYRLAARAAALDPPAAETFRAVVPTRALREVQRLAAEDDAAAQVTLGSNHARFELTDAVVTSSLIEGHFPDHSAVIPTDYHNRIRVEREALAATIRRAQVVAREDGNKVVLRAEEGKMTVQASSPGLGQFADELPVALEGGEVVVSCNAKYLLDVLSVLAEQEADIELKGAASPGLIKPADGVNYNYVFMPIALPEEG
jgi:DNA polymerase-3 subunit beta